jgi:hypothetical protein
MTQENINELLWSELSSINNIDDRIVAIYKDIQSDLRKYQILAEEEPQRLFELLGGSDSEITTSNWAFEYSYEDYIQENDIEYDANEANEWDLEEKSIEHANDSGHWYVTGICIIEGPNNVKLEFEFEYCDGYLDGIIGTPYNETEHGDHGILFDLFA